MSGMPCQGAVAAWSEILPFPAIQDPCAQSTLPTSDIDPHVAEQLRLAAAVFASTREGIVITDALGRIVEVNDAFVAITGYPRSGVLGRNAAMLVSGEHGQGFLQALRSSLHLTGSWQGEVWSRRADGELMVELLRVRAVHSPCGELTHYVGAFSDITSHKRQQEHHMWLVHHDVLTGLPNRTLALDRLGMLIDQAKCQSRQLAVCYLDLDGFMAVNERIGHALGDGLLKAAAERAHQAVRAGDTVARLEGDEFVLLLGDLCDARAVQPILERVLHALAQPFVIGDQQVVISASIGVALYPGDGDTPERLLRAADQAMYRAKSLGKNRVCMASQTGEHTLAPNPLQQEIQAALQRDELRLHYQPKVCARTGRCLGAEALVRWQHPQRGLLAPGSFLPAITGTPLEIELDLWVVKHAVTQLAHWRAGGRTLQLSINVSPGTLLLPDMANIIAATMRHAAVGSRASVDGIELEVLETAALDDLDAAIRAIRACAQHGLTFALDDFGTGYSSLSYLRRLPVSTLKIDRSFVSNMLGSRGDLHIVRAVIGLAEAFGVTTVAEGVETAEQAQVLADLGCDQLQGFGIARPMPAQALERWLDEQAVATAVSDSASRAVAPEASTAQA